MTKKIPKRTKEKSLRHKLALEKYLDPESETFLNKSQTLKKIGYSEKVANHDGWKILDNSSITSTQLEKLQPFISQLPSVVDNLQRKLDIISKSKTITAKDYTALLRHTELIAKCAGIIKNRVETESVNINIDIPVSKCPNCGYVMDIMAEDEKETPKIG